jgi:hypothetical protein
VLFITWYTETVFRVRVVLSLSQAIWLHFNAVGFFSPPVLPPLLLPPISQPGCHRLCSIAVGRLVLTSDEFVFESGGVRLPSDPVIRLHRYPLQVRHVPRRHSDSLVNGRSISRNREQLDLFFSLASCVARLGSSRSSALGVARLSTSARLGSTC